MRPCPSASHAAAARRPWLRYVLLMTVAVGVKVFDGIVLATDSATTLGLDGGGAQVYNTANKLFQLHRELPIAAMTWGLGSIGDASISTLAKDLRRRLMGRDPGFAWALDPAAYSIEQVANYVVDMIFSELYDPIIAAHLAGSPTGTEAPFLGFMVAGFSAGSRQTEAWTISIEAPGVKPVPELAIKPDQSGWVVYAMSEATQRLFNGWDPTIPEKLAAVVPAQMPAIMGVLEAERRMAVPAAMPFADAINFAKFLVEVTAGYSHFLLGPDVVGGPIDIAGISRHEGFRWIERKHYYRPELNPKEPHP